ncbi:methyl-accepting chemotaxis protein [Pseudomonas sp. HMWF032]|nr:methyl-accepting chemotaxis protein [Pseudomonas sp. HMWF032]PTT86260.1 methyl-accepting chemotaxis protein [Pseudomonas sp. HMWF010]
MNLKQLSMIQRLSLCFAALLSLLAIILAISLIQISKLHGKIDDLVHENFPKTVLANNVIDETNAIARAVRTMLIAEDDQRLVDSQRKQIEEATLGIQNATDKLNAVAKTAEEREYLAALGLGIKNFNKHVERYLELYDDGNLQAAREYLLKDLREAQLETQAQTNQVIDIQNKGVEDLGKIAENLAADTRTLLLSIGFAALLLAVLLAVLLIRSVRRQLGADPLELAQITNSIAAGQLQLEIPAALPGSVMDSLKGMLESLQASAAAAQSNARIKSALDNVSSNVMIADNERNIIYMNRTVTAMMQNVESDLRKVLPTFEAKRLLGGSIDQFHKKPEHQKHLLATFTSTFNTQIEVGGRTFALIANPVFSDSGERLGAVVEWNDRTLEVAVEREVADLVNAAADGDFSRRLELGNKAGFLLNLATGLNQLVETADRGLQDVVRMLGALAQGDLTLRITDQYQGTFGQLKDFSNETAVSLSRMLGQIRESADTIYTAANEISVGNTDLSSRTEEQASSLEETASSMEELTSTVKLNADNARQANSLAMNASEVASDGGQLVERVVQTMSSINDSSRKISDIIGVIDGIAFQTNILALNAAVEAARAGEQGRGFAVVAAEVRNLAQRSAAAAKEIKTLISDSVDKVETGNTLVAQAGKTMTEIVTAIKRVTDIMAEIAAASAEQSSGIEEVNGAVSQMDEMTQQNAALVEQAAAAAESLLEQATSMTETVAIFKFEHAHQRPALSAPPAAPKASANPPTRTARAQRSLPPRANTNNSDEWEQF